MRKSRSTLLILILATVVVAGGLAIHFFSPHLMGWMAGVHGHHGG